MNKTHQLSALLFGGALLALSSSANAAVIVAYNFNGNANPSTEAVGLDASTVVGGPGTANAATTATSATGWIVSGATPSGYSAGSGGNGNFFGRTASATANVSYIEFTVTPDADHRMTFTTISFDYLTNSSYNNATFDNTFTVRSSLDGFDNDIGAGWTMTGISTSAFASTGNITLSGFEDIESAITFRLYAQKTASNYSSQAYSNGAEISRWDNISIEGSIAVIPEPSAALLGGLGFLALLRRRR